MYKTKTNIYKEYMSMYINISEYISFIIYISTYLHLSICIYIYHNDI